MKIDKIAAATFSESWNFQAERGVDPGGLGGSRPPRFWAKGVVGCRRGGRGSRGRVV